MLASLNLLFPATKGGKQGKLLTIVNSSQKLPFIFKQSKFRLLLANITQTVFFLNLYFSLNNVYSSNLRSYLWKLHFQIDLTFKENLPDVLPQVLPLDLVRWGPTFLRPSVSSSASSSWKGRSRSCSGSRGRRQSRSPRTSRSMSFSPEKKSILVLIKINFSFFHKN